MTDLPDRCDVAVVGAGVTGLSVALELVLRGRGPIAVFDRTGIAAEASGLQPGGVRQQWSTRVNCLLARESVAFYRTLADHLDVPDPPPVFEPCGYLFLAHSAQQLARLEADVAVQNEAGVPSSILSPAEAAQAVPDLDVESVLGAAWCGEDGYFDRPQSVIEAFAATVQRRGVTVAHAGVEALTMTGEGWELQLSDGSSVRAQSVLLAAGYDTPALSSPLGIELPIRKEPRYLFMSEPIRERLLEPLVISPERGFAAKQLSSGRVLASDLRAGAIDGEQQEVWRRRVSEQIESLLPRLVYVSLPMLIEGFYDCSPDNQPIIGPVADGLWVASGYSGHGFMLAPAISRRLAASICGEPDDGLLAAFSPERFSAGPAALVRESAIV
jgi:sarcosine oxidase, subunit beta